MGAAPASCRLPQQVVESSTLETRYIWLLAWHTQRVTERRALRVRQPQRLCVLVMWCWLRRTRLGFRTGTCAARLTGMHVPWVRGVRDAEVKVDIKPAFLARRHVEEGRLTGRLPRVQPMAHLLATSAAPRFALPCDPAVASHGAAWSGGRERRNAKRSRRSALSKRTRTLGHYHTEPY